MDQFAEQLVRKERTTKDDLKKTLLIAGAAVLCIGSLLLVFMGFPIALALPIGIIYLVVWLMKFLKVEYEYSCTNGALDIDKIMGETKRVNMLSVEVSSFTAYGKYDDYDPGEDSVTTFSAIGTTMMEEDASELYYALFEHDEHGACCLVFNPDSRMRSAIEPFLPKSVRVNLNK
ncbi:MAG: hypothetical protein IJN11_00715 [Oscillospiraceae bacterium]|nr:hypothetical protein [Oscillospiraceae bacterium]